LSRTLVIHAPSAEVAASRREAQGARLLAWAEALPDASERDAVDEAAMAWAKTWGRRPLDGGRSFRELATWKGVSLWWFAEIYLYYSAQSPRHVRTIETALRVFAREQPDEVETLGLPETDAVLIGRACTAYGALFHGPRRVPGLAVWLATWRTSLASRLNTLKGAATLLKAHLAGAPSVPRALRARVLFLSHAAFWRGGQEHYFGRLIPDVAADPALEAWVLGVGPRAPFRHRGRAQVLREWLRLRPSAGSWEPLSRFLRFAVFREVLRGTRQVRALWRDLADSPAMRESFSHRGVSFADFSGPDLAGTLLLQLPWSIRAYEELQAAFSSARPAALCLYAESSGLGRVAVAAARAAGVPSVAIQHGILYPKYYSYRHDPDEAESPRPDRTALFGEAAREFLAGHGRYPAEGLVLTGSPKFDDIVTRTRGWNREALRARLGAAADDKLLVVASRFRGIVGYQSIGSALPTFVRAVEASPGVRCVVKPHPAENPGVYAPSLAASPSGRVCLAPSGLSLLEMLHAADALVTVESLSAVEALVASRPVLLLNTPTNLRELEDAGVALGVPEGHDPAPALSALLFDAATRERLAKARERYLSRVACGIDGRATERLLALIRDTALGAPSL
jgi:hypothetical protein